MKAIQTRFIPCTDTKGARIKAMAEGVKSLAISYPHELGQGEPAHKSAALALCKRQGWSADIVGGGLPNGDYVFCFDDGRLKVLRSIINARRDGRLSGNPYCAPEFRDGMAVIGRAYGFTGPECDCPTRDDEIAAWLAKQST